PTTFVSYSQLRAEISAALVEQMLQARPLPLVADTEGVVSGAVTELQFNISVSNPGPGGGPAATPDPSISRIFPQNLAPGLISISPAEGVAGTPFLLSLSGNNFNATSIINFGGSQFSPTVSTPTSMSVTIPGSLLSPGPVQVSVTNPAPGGGTTPTIPFIVN